MDMKLCLASRARNLVSFCFYFSTAGIVENFCYIQCEIQVTVSLILTEIDCWFVSRKHDNFLHHEVSHILSTSLVTWILLLVFHLLIQSGNSCFSPFLITSFWLILILHILTIKSMTGKQCLETILGKYCFLIDKINQLVSFGSLNGFCLIVNTYLFHLS